MRARRRARTRGRQGIARSRPWLAALLVAAGCATGGEPSPPSVDAGPLARALHEAAAPPDALWVRLAFGAEADLDLYVTGPLDETVYYGNTPSRIGGRLLADQRCDAPAPRIETVVFAAVRPGRYRVGVDLPERCDGAHADVPFVLEVRSPRLHEQRSGRIARGAFAPIVFEWWEEGR